MNLDNQLVFIDLETTGLDTVKHAPITIGALVLGGPNHDLTFHRKMRPWHGAIVDPRAMAVNGYDELEIWSWSSPSQACLDFISWIERICPAPNLLIAAGWNYSFDERFLRSWIFQHYPEARAFYGNTFSENYVEGMTVVKATYPDWSSRFPKQGGMKLTYQYEYHFGYHYKDAHTEMADCYATRRIVLACDAKRERPIWPEHHPLIHLPEPGADPITPDLL